jgi:hypothetical protein
MSNEAIIKELRNLNKVIDELLPSPLRTLPQPLIALLLSPLQKAPTTAFAAELRDYGNDYAMENGKLSSALYLAADTIETLLAEREQ